MFDKRKNQQEDSNTLTVAPSVSIHDKEKDIVLCVEMPGAARDTMEVNLDGNVLSVKGKKRKDEIGREYRVIHQERRPLEYRRTFELNTDVDRNKLKAEYKNGVLKVILARSEKVLPKNIRIET